MRAIATVGLIVSLAQCWICETASADTFHVEPQVELFYTDEGKGPALLFVPGWTMTGDVFEKQRTHFKKTHRVITVDPRGQGRSGKGSAQHTYMQQGNDIHALLNHLGLEDVTLVGWSYGCLASYAYVRQHGHQNISKFVCIDQTPHPLDLPGGPKWNEGPATNTRWAFDMLNYNRSDFTKTFAAWMVSRELSAEELRWITEMSESTPTGIAVQLGADALVSDYRAELITLSKQVPTLLVLNEEGPNGPRWMAQNAPKAHVVQLGRHMMFWEDAEEFNGILSRFLQGKAPSEPDKKKKKRKRKAAATPLPESERWWPHPLWGEGDQAGASNWITPEKVQKSLSLVTTGRVYELGHPYTRDMPLLVGRSYEMFIPSFPTGGPFTDPGFGQGFAYNDEYLCTQIGQVGTQFDGPGHVAQMITWPDGEKDLAFYNGFRGKDVKSPYGLHQVGVEHVKPYITRGILIDIAGFKDVDTLPHTYEVTMKDVRGALAKQGLKESDIQPGDAILFNFGWWRRWESGSIEGWPGVGHEVTDWLLERQPSIVGSDAATDHGIEIHVKLTLHHGIFNLEFMRFDTLLEDEVYEFLFVFTPIRFEGATGSPGRPLAIR